MPVREMTLPIRMNIGTTARSWDRSASDKVYGSAPKALDGLLSDGMPIAAGGFGLCGIPALLIDAIRAAGRAI